MYYPAFCENCWKVHPPGALNFCGYPFWVCFKCEVQSLFTWASCVFLLAQFLSKYMYNKYFPVLSKLFLCVSVTVSCQYMHLFKGFLWNPAYLCVAGWKYWGISICKEQSSVTAKVDFIDTSALLQPGRIIQVGYLSHSTQ